MIQRKINEKTYTAAAKRLAERYLRKAGIARHFYGFRSDPGFYLIIDGFTGQKVKSYCVPCAGAHALQITVADFVKDWKAVKDAA